MKASEVLEKLLKGKRLKEDTIFSYRRVFRTLDDWPSSPGEVLEWLGRLSLGDQTVRTYFRVAKSAARYMERYYDLQNVFRNVETPRVEKKRRRCFTVDELTRIIHACRSEMEQLMILCLIDSGCRIGELASLRRESVGEGFVLVKGKTGERRYRLDAVLCRKLVEVAGTDGCIWRNKSGKLMSRDALKNRARTIVTRAGIGGAKIGPHTLRHTAASLVARETGSALCVKALLQHDSISSSMVYIHDVEGDLQKRVSPLALVRQQVSDAGFCLVAEPAENSEEFGHPRVDEGEVVDVVDLVSSRFRGVGDDVVVHSRLRASDLRLIRQAMVSYIYSGADRASAKRCSALYARMLRKVEHHGENEVKSERSESVGTSLLTSGFIKQ